MVLIAPIDNILYTLLELSSEISSATFPHQGELEILPTMSKPLPLPPGMLAAEILLPEPNHTYPTPYIYLSNRNDPSPKGDIISIFAIKPALKLVAEVHSGLDHLRGMLFGGEDDKYLIAGGANSKGVKVFERVDGGLGLKLVASNEDIEVPTSFLWL